LSGLLFRVVVQTEKKIVKMNEEIKKSLSLENAVSGASVVIIDSCYQPNYSQVFVVLISLGEVSTLRRCATLHGLENTPRL